MAYPKGGGDQEWPILREGGGDQEWPILREGGGDQEWPILRERGNWRVKQANLVVLCARFFSIIYILIYLSWAMPYRNF